MFFSSVNRADETALFSFTACDLLARSLESITLVSARAIRATRELIEQHELAKQREHIKHEQRRQLTTEALCTHCTDRQRKS